MNTRMAWYYSMESSRRLQLLFKSFLPSVFFVLDSITSCLTTLIRLGAGVVCASDLDKCKRPEKPIIYYGFESCPYCRRVRELMSVLDIDYISYPTPKETLQGQGVTINSRYRPVVLKTGGKIAFPYIEDPNTDTKMYESEDIVAYLIETYGSKAKMPLCYDMSTKDAFLDWTRRFPITFRPLMQHGTLRCASKLPQKMLELYNYEGSMFCRRVREFLDCNEIPYLVKNVAFNTLKTIEMKQGNKNIMCTLGVLKTPVLWDPNTEKEVFGPYNIIKHIEEEYTTSGFSDCGTWLDFMKAIDSKKKSA